MSTRTEKAAEKYRQSLPRSRRGTLWTPETAATYITTRYPHITIKPGQEWVGATAKYTFICSKHGEFESLLGCVLHRNKGCRCAQCAVDGLRARKGIMKPVSSTKEERQQAVDLYSIHNNYAEVARILDRSESTIKQWVGAAYKAEHRARASRNRLQNNSLQELVLLDGKWLEVDMPMTWRLWNTFLLPPKERKAIQELYLECQYMTETTGVEHHVDHIHPLSVGGEHCLVNLQIIPASENIAKSSDFRHQDQVELCKRLFNVQ